MEKRSIPYGEMLERSTKFFGYFGALLIAAVILLSIGLGIPKTPETGRATIIFLDITLTLGALCAVGALVCAEVSMAWDKKSVERR